MLPHCRQRLKVRHGLGRLEEGEEVREDQQGPCCAGLEISNRCKPYVVCRDDKVRDRHRLKKVLARPHPSPELIQFQTGALDQQLDQNCFLQHRC